MTKTQILAKIRQDLRANVEARYRDGARRFFNEEVDIMGVRTGLVRKIARTYWADIKNWEKKEILELAEELLASGVAEESTVAFEWAVKLKPQYEPADFMYFERWLKKYADNWAKVDDLCTHIIGPFFLRYPEYVKKIHVWAQSRNRWERRGAAVSLIPAFKQRQFYDELIKVATTMMMDNDDLVQKGYGWALKEASKYYNKEVFDFVMKNKAKMPRTALRYAIEHYPPAKRKQAMS